MGVGASAGATQGVLGNAGTSSDGERRAVKDLYRYWVCALVLSFFINPIGASDQAW